MKFKLSANNRFKPKIGIKLKGKHMSLIQNERKQHIETILANHSQTKDYPIEVMDDNGVIILTGMVPSKVIKASVERLVRKQESVTSVINALDVGNIEVEPVIIRSSTPPTRPTQ
jgi:osmotically-inducible protein OsmY